MKRDRLQSLPISNGDLASPPACKLTLALSLLTCMKTESMLEEINLLYNMVDEGLVGDQEV